MTDNQVVSIRFPELDLADAGVSARSLREAILDATEDAKVELRKEDDTTMDLGSTLIAVLGTGSIIAVAKGISQWLVMNRQIITIKRANGDEYKFVGNNMSVDDNAVALIKAIVGEQAK